MRILVCGSRHYNGFADFSVELNKIHAENKITTVISGGAKGADTMAENWAKEHNIAIIVEHADWERYGKKAGPIRNLAMLRYEPDLVVAFMAADSKGTRRMVKIATEAGIPVKVIEV